MNPGERSVTIDRCANGYVVTYRAEPTIPRQSEGEHSSLERHIFAALNEVYEFIGRTLG